MKRRGLGLTGRMVTMTIIPIVLLSVFMSAFIGYSGYKNVYNEVSHELSSVCVSVFELLEHSERYQSAKYDYFGENKNMFDYITERTGIYITVFEGDERKITTTKTLDGSRAVGTRASAEVVKTVLGSGEEFISDNVDVNGAAFFGIYMPIIGDDGDVTGMVFAGKSRASVLNNIVTSVLGSLAISWIMAIAAAILSILVSRRMVRSLLLAAEFLKKISLGDTECVADERLVNRGDEIGEMGRSAVKLQQSLRELISNDPLTGLYNRRACRIKMNDLCEKAAEGVPFVAAIGDIDFFKRFNDRYGHACGDAVLRDIARLLEEGVRGKGFASRWGGEEFLVVFGGVSYQEAVETLYRIMEEIRAYRCEFEGKRLPVTMTFGISAYQGGTIDALVSAADDKLYYGKNHGRNCVIEEIPEENGEKTG